MSEDSGGADRRKWSRKKPILYLGVHEERLGALGRVGDLSAGGLLLYHEQAIGAGQALLITIDLPDYLEEPRRLELDAVCRWTSPERMRGHLRSGIEFTGLSADKMAGLRPWVERFMGELGWSIRQEEAQTIVELFGSLDENAALGELAEGIRGPVCFDLAKVRRINPEGARAWLWFVDRIAALGPHRVRRCSPPWVAQLNVLAGFHGNARIESVMASFICPDCERESLLEVKVDDGKVERARPELPIVRCGDCKTSMFFDDVEEEFFAFMKQEETGGHPADSEHTDDGR